MDALGVMFDFHPILSMCISDDYEVPYLVKSRRPSISLMSGRDKDAIIGFLTEPFDLHDSLSRFLIVEDDDDYSLFAVFHHLVYDISSKQVFRQDLETILAGGSIDMDTSFLKVAAFNQQVPGTDEFNLADEFFASMLADSEEAGVLLEDVSCDGPGFHHQILEFDNGLLSDFLKEHNVSENITEDEVRNTYIEWINYLVKWYDANNE